MSQVLLISVRLHEGRYHGAGDEPPAPARLFQALVAASGLSGPLTTDEIRALEWLEKLDPPVIATPRMWNGQPVTNYVPNNDLDAVEGDPRRIGLVRTPKVIKPKSFDSTVPLLFGWPFVPDSESEQFVSTICGLAERVYQFGRGVDFAWAWAEVLDNGEFESRLFEFPGIVYRPGLGGRGATIACPQKGTLHSLRERYQKGGKRFLGAGRGKSVKYQFTQAPKPRFAQVTYDSPPVRRVFDLRPSTNDLEFASYPLERASPLVSELRDGAVNRLRNALPHRAGEIDRALIGRKPDGSNAIASSARVRIIPLPSIGHQHADLAIRRVLVEVPGSCPLRADDTFWSFSGLELQVAELDVAGGITISQADDESMLAHYGLSDRGFRTWRTVTPVALPEQAKRRRIDPGRLASERKAGSERADEQSRAAAAIVQALRHADVRAQVEAIQVQREPFDANGSRVESFSAGTRFEKERLWHVQVRFSNAVNGPLIIGDGRFLGLGLMAPISRAEGIHAFAVSDGLSRITQPAEISRAMRLAVMARVQAVVGSRVRLAAYFTGHERDGSPTAAPHLTFTFDPNQARVLVIAPHVVSRRPPTHEERKHLDTLDQALSGMFELRAGASGCLRLQQREVILESDAIFAPSRIWESITTYVVTRHSKESRAADAFAADLRAECVRQGLPLPQVTCLECQGIPGVGLAGFARLTFGMAIDGPVILGKTRHLGGGLFQGKGSP